MPPGLQQDRTTGLRRWLALVIALAGCTTEPSAPFEPATYILQSIGGRPIPAEYSSTKYPDREERVIFVYDTVTIVSDTQFVRSFKVNHLSVQATLVDTTAESVNYPGAIVHRDDAVLLFPQSGLGISIETIELLPAVPNLRRRMRISEWRCEVPPSPPFSPPCEVLLDELVDALYVRR